MGNITTAAEAAYPDFNVPNDPKSGEAEPEKSDIRDLFALIDSSIQALVSSGVLAGLYASAAAGQADTGLASGKPFGVFPSTNGGVLDLYRKEVTAPATLMGALLSIAPGDIAANMQDIINAAPNAAAARESANAAEDARDAAESSAATALVRAASSWTAAQLAGVISKPPYLTKAAATADLANIAANAWIVVLADESDGGGTNFYQHVGSALANKTPVSGPVKAGPVSITTSARTVSCSSWSFIDAVGLTIPIPAQSITLPPNQALWLVLELGALTLHFFKYSVGDGIIPLALITTDANSVVSITNLWDGTLPKSGVSKFSAKLAHSTSSGDATASSYGDSTVYGSGSGTPWPSLAFDSTYAASGLNVLNAANLVFHNRATGASSSHLFDVWFAEARLTNKGTKFAGRAIDYGPESVMRLLNPPYTGIGRSPCFAAPTDLVILGWGANGGSDMHRYGEKALLNAMLAGSEVALFGEHPRSDSITFLESNIPIFAAMANHFGCAYINTWCWIYEAYQKYTMDSTHNGSPWNDAIHLSGIGHQAEAAAVRAVVSPGAGAGIVITLEPKPTKTSRLLRSGADGLIDPRYYALAENCSQIVFVPSEHTGTEMSSGLTDPDKCPSLAFGAATSPAKMIALQAGQYVETAHANISSVSFMFLDDYLAGTGWTVEIRTANGAILLGSVSYVSGGSTGHIASAFGVDIGTLGGDPGRTNNIIRLLVTAGEMDWLSTFAGADRTRDLDLSKDVTYTGTWDLTHNDFIKYTATGDLWLGQLEAPYSDTAGSGFWYRTTSSEDIVYLGKSSAGAKVDVYVDGVLTISQANLFVSGTDYRIVALRIPANRKTTDYGPQPPVEHTVKVVMNGADASAVAPGTPNGFQTHRLVLLGVHAKDRR